jgi:Undecaprenyl-phosphate galactose phosphotransferase WbaP
MTREDRIPIENLSDREVERLAPRALHHVYARQWMSSVLILTDLFCLAAAMFFGLQLRQLALPTLDLAYSQFFIILAIILLLKFSRTGLYPGLGLHYVDELRKLVNSISTTFVIVLAVTVLLQTSIIYSRLALIYSWLFSILLIPLGRYLVVRLMIHLGLWGVPVVIIGDQGKALALAKHLRIGLHYGFRPSLVIADEIQHSGHQSVDAVNFLANLKERSQRLHLQEAIILVDDLFNIDLLIERYRFIFKNVILVKDQSGKYGLNNLEMLDFDTALGLQLRNNLLSRSAQLTKKVLDTFLAAIALLLLAPFFGLMALAIYLDSPGRVFYRQARLGKEGKVFHLVKFRTMQLNAGEILKKELAHDPAIKLEWDTFQKLKRDPRITRVGKLLRKFSLDELPQLWNILHGDMSMVGPRPIMLDQQLPYGSYYKDYIKVRPGITGLWQVSGRNHTSFARRAELDNEYIQRWSLWLDIYIFFKTVKVVLWRNGAY